ncbi:MAG: TolB family protein [Candidatus Dormibacteria bacterium]
MRRGAIIALLAVLMAGFGLGVNRYLAGNTRVDQINDRAVRPPTELPTNLDLPGTLVVAQRGRLFRLANRHFTELETSAAGQWMQPASANDGRRLVVVRRDAQSSDLYLIDADGNVVRQLTRNAARAVDQNHWAFWPRVSGDGTTIFASHDSPKNGYDVDLAIWSGPLNGKALTHRWSSPNQFTGGDTHPAPLGGGGIIYSQYAIADGKVSSRLVMQRALTSEALGLTNPKDDCDQAALSPDGDSVAMVCSQGKQTTRLVVGRLTGRTLENLRVVVADCLCSAPAWAPDGSGIAYVAPADSAGHFQLWWAPTSAEGGARPPQRVTNNLDIDATSAPAWLTVPPSRETSSPGAQSATPSP